MKYSCVAYQCSNNDSPKIRQQGISFHLFPSETQAPDLRKIWIRNCRWQDWEPEKLNAVCSEHFEPQCFRMNDGLRLLKKNACPTKFKFPPPSESALQKKKEKEAQEERDRTRKFIEQGQAIEGHMIGEFENMKDVRVSLRKLQITDLNGKCFDGKTGYLTDPSLPPMPLLPFFNPNGVCNSSEDVLPSEIQSVSGSPEIIIPPISKKGRDETDVVDLSDPEWSPDAEVDPLQASPAKKVRKPTQAKKPKPARKRPIAPKSTPDHPYASNQYPDMQSVNIRLTCQNDKLMDDLREAKATIKQLQQQLKNLKSVPTNPNMRQLMPIQFVQVVNALPALPALQALQPVKPTHLEKKEKEIQNMQTEIAQMPKMISRKTQTRYRDVYGDMIGNSDEEPETALSANHVKLKKMVRNKKDSLRRIKRKAMTKKKSGSSPSKSATPSAAQGKATPESARNETESSKENSDPQPGTSAEAMTGLETSIQTPRHDFVSDGEPEINPNAVHINDEEAKALQSILGSDTNNSSPVCPTDDLFEMMKE